MPTATQNEHDNAHEPVLLMAFELSEQTWKRGCTLGPGQPPRERPMAARDTPRLLHAVAHATARLGLGATAPVVRGDEAGREGVWVQRLLQAQGSTQQGVDAASMAVHRRQRRATSEA
jgi:transposase